MNQTPVVFLYDHFYPDYSAGGPVTSLANLSLLLKEKKAVRIICSSREFQSGRQVQGIELNQWAQWNGIPVWYADDKRSLNRALLKLPAGTTLFLNGIFSLTYFLHPLRYASRSGLKVIVSPRGMLQQGALQDGYLKKKIYLALLNLSGLFNKVSWHATDEQEARDIQRHIRSSKQITIIPNIPKAPTDHKVELEKKPGSLRLVYFSLISAKKNLTFLLDVLDSPELNHVTLDIFGPVKDHAYWERCQEKMKTAGNASSIRYKGEVHPEQVSSLLAQYHFFVLPTKGENFGHAILEALGSFRPVIISDQTPWKDLEPAGAGFAIPLLKETWRKTLMIALHWDQARYDHATSAALGYYRTRIDLEQWKGMYLKLFE